MRRDDAFIKRMFKYSGVTKQLLLEYDILPLIKASRFRLRTYIRVKVDTFRRITPGWNIGRRTEAK